MLNNPPSKLIDLSDVRGNILNISELQQIYAPRLGGNLTLRYVSDGREDYTVNGHFYSVENGQYLISNKHCTGKVSIDSLKPVKGICIDLSQEVVAEVFSRLTEPSALEVVTDLKDSLYGPNFMESRSLADQSQTGHIFRQLERFVFDPNFKSATVGIDFFYSVCERVVSDYVPIQQRLNKIRSIKFCTKKDLLRRLQKGKELLDELSLYNPSIEGIARECGISQYHFYRLFKSTFGQSPNQYLQGKRLEFAYHQLQTKPYAISDLAIVCGYPDLASFSKAFKKRFGLTPGSLKNSRI